MTMRIADSIWRRFAITEVPCRTVEKRNERNYIADWLYRALGNEDRKKSREASSETVYFYPCSHFEANTKLDYFLSDVTNMRDRKFVMIRVHLNRYFSLTKIRMTNF